ncbi:carbohydrate-binding domain-containing protein [Flavobacterium psychrotrophum]|uniref:carbohydrate-binding domain-containing protein n=1 Tax=Flavobacterium psychrotrophum TaxID=2294119 RepID=UPI000E32306B|nr:carbohydrate-binding domain-containing protein [Flavobacterium psychrotrophum]
MKKVQILPLAAFAIMSMASCSDDDSNSANNGNQPGQVTAEANIEEAGDYNFSSNAKQIQLNGTSATSDDTTVTTNEGSKITITQAGTYHVSGNLTDGQLVVDADQEDRVQIILDNVSIASSGSAAIDIKNADKVVINVKAGTTNTIADRNGNNQDSAIFSRTKLSIFGTGTLNVNGNDNAAISSQGGIILKESTFNFTANEDAVKTDHNIIVYSGSLNIDADGDGFNAEEDITINNGTINITQSEDGFDASAVNILDGNIRIVAKEDGISVDGEHTNASTELIVRDGYLYINAGGNGFDADGSITIEDGTVIIDGPTSNDNVAVSYSSNFNINGGYFIAVNGSSNIDAPSNSSAQNSVLVKFDATQSANTLVHLQTTLGANITTFRPSKSFKTLLVSSASISDNGSFQLYTGGTVTGDVLDGLYDFISYVGGALQATFTVSGSVTTVNTTQS